MSSTARRYLAPYASLKLTVVLMAMATFLVFAGTVAQIDKGIWTVVDEYFRCALAWIDLQIFFPRDWDVPGGFWFPGGWLIAGALLVNLLVAHLIRFKVAASGARLLAGVVVLAAGAVLTGLVMWFTRPYGDYLLFNTDGFQYKQILASITPEQVPVIGLVLGFFLGEQVLHYYSDRRLFRFRHASVRRKVAPLLLGAP